MLAAYTNHRGDADLLQRHSRIERVEFCTSIEAACELLQRHRLRFFLCDIDSVNAAGHKPSELIFRVATLPVRTAIVVRFDLAAGATTQLFRLAQLSIDLRDSWRPSDDLGSRLHDPEAGVGPSALWRLLREIGENTPAHLQPLFGTMAVLCRRVVSEGDVGRLLDRSGETIGTWLRRERRRGLALPTFPKLNAAFLGVYACWHRQELRLNAKTTASLAGFASADKLDEYFRLHYKMSVARMVALGGFEHLLSDVARWFRPMAGGTR